MRRRTFLATIGAAATALAVPRVAGAQAGTMLTKRKRPNVILVMTDDQGYGDLGVHGNPIIKTPNIDALSKECTQFTDFHVCPTCAPTRSALMSGHYSLRTGIWHTIMGRSIMRRDEVTMGDVFSANGYRTGFFGKWHLGDNWPYRPEDRGFQEVMAHGGGGMSQTPDYWGNDYFDDTYMHNGEPEKHEGYCTDVWFKAATNFIRKNKDRPFFAYLPTNAPHSPYNVPEEYSAMYKGKPVPNAKFYGMITNIDENIGRLLAMLKETGLEENTILIFMTDNGTAAGVRMQNGKQLGFNAGMRGKKGSQYDGGHRVPCFVRWPAGKIGAGGRVEHITAHFDLLPTLIELCGMKPPEGIDFDGRSLVPLLRDPAASWPDRAIMVDTQRIERPEKWRNSAVMTDDWRLINGKELYAIKPDPGQKKDVAKAHPDVVERLRKKYEAWWTDISEHFDEFCEIPLDPPGNEEVRLCCHDWHGPQVPWNQPHILKGLVANGFWAVEAGQAGTYSFSLRRWPKEANAPITGAVPGGKAIQATEARIRVGDQEARKAIPEGAFEVTFKLKLKAGKTKVQTWLSDGEESRGAYYVYVKRV